MRAIMAPERKSERYPYPAIKNPPRAAKRAWLNTIPIFVAVLAAVRHRASTLSWLNTVRTTLAMEAMDKKAI